MKKVYFLIIACLFNTNILLADAFGTLVGTFNGVAAYSNGNTGYESGIYNTSAGINTGMKWQCIEYVNRYYYLIYGLDLKSTGIYGNANHYYNNAASAGLNAYPNGGSTTPQIGDIICSNGGLYGHVAIIREVGTNYINVIQQNWSNNSNDNNKTLAKSGNTISDFGSGYPIAGWVRVPQITPSCTFNVSVDGGSQTSLVQGWKFWQMTNPDYYHIYGTISNLPGGSAYTIWLANSSGSALAQILSNQTATTFNFGFSANSPYNNGEQYTLIFCPQGVNTTIWTQSPWFYMSALPTLSISVSPTPLMIGQQGAVNWSVNGGIPSLPDGGWINNIQLQWYQGGTSPSNALSLLATPSVADHSYNFTVPASIPNATIPGSNFYISGSNPANTSIPTGYVYNFTNSFSIVSTNNIDKNLDDKLKFSIYPNPATNKITILNSADIHKETIVSIYNIKGEQVMTNAFNYQNSMEVDVSSLAKGVYIVKIQSEKGVGCRKLLIQ